MAINVEETLLKIVRELGSIKQLLDDLPCKGNSYELQQHGKRLSRLSWKVNTLWIAFSAFLGLVCTWFLEHVGLFVLCISLLCLQACTYIHYGDMHYVSIMQEKTLSVDYVGKDGGKTVLTYATNSDPAVEAFKQGVAAGATLAGAEVVK